MLRTMLITILTTGLVSGVLAGPAAQAQNDRSPRYKVLDLGPLGGTYSQAFYVSNSGVTSGEATLPNGEVHAVLWEGESKTDLGTLGGPDSSAFGSPNITGQVVGGTDTSATDPNGEDFCAFIASGFSSSGTCVGFIWQDGRMKPLSTLGGPNSAANAINDLGEVVGAAETAAKDSTCPPYDPAQGQYQVLRQQPVVWNDGHIQQLPTYSGDPDGVAIAINGYGQVAGTSGYCSTNNPIDGFYIAPVHALLWDNGTATDLGSLGGEFGNQAKGINNSGQVVGASDLAGDAVFHAFIWSRSTGMRDLGTVGTDIYSAALAINDAGQAVGVSIDSTFSVLTAFVVVDGSMTNLNNLTSSQSPLQLLTACGINSRGEIAGFAMNKTTGEYHGYLAIPIAGTNALY